MLSKYYTPTGQTSSGKVVTAYLSLLAICYGLSMVYIGFVHIIPIIYLRIFLTGIMIFSLVFITRNIAKICKFRYRREFISLILFGAGVVYYFSWVVFIAFGADDQIYSGIFNPALHLDIMFSPLFFLEAIGFIYHHGLYALNGAAVNGNILVIVWIVEAAMIFIFPWLLMRKRNIPPFSSKLDKWYPKYNLKHLFEYVVTTKRLKEDFESDYKSAIENLGKGMPNRFGQLNVYYLPNETDAYLSVTNIGYEKGGQGKRSENVVLYLLRIEPEYAEQLLKKYGKDKEFFLDQ